jgi:hypothetical protein
MYNLKKIFPYNEVKYDHMKYSKPNKNSCQQIRCYILSNKFILIATICLFFYYLFMDINLYSKATRRHLFEVLTTTTSLAQNTERHGFLKQITSFNVFYPLTVKKIMMCDTTHYIRSPLAELVEDLFGFSDIFPFIGANVISLTHCLLSLFAIRFLSHKTLFYRQLGVCIFQFRNFLDSFDGVVYRAHSKHKHAYKSVYGSHGYFIDAVSDVFGGICLTVAIGLYLLKHPPPKRNRTYCFDMTPLNYQHEKLTTSRLSSKIAIVLSVVMIGIRLALSGLFWDRSVHAYEDLLDSKPFSIVHEVCFENFLRKTQPQSIWQK